ncbi:septum formation family protein [Isoptericola halotolerans]|uniref:septum formation family protein n=1 Tax=Isoptericola halotolerans TaxID=300560 RepID=UPI00388FC535
MTDVPDRPEDPQFVSPGPGTGPAPDRVPADVGMPGPGGPPARAASAPEQVPGVAADDPAAFGARWGAPGGPTAAERAAARRRARAWVVSVLGVIVLVVAVAAGGAWAVDRAHEQAWAPVAADVDEPRQVNAVQLVLGSCVAVLPEGSAVATVEVVPCGDGHVAQVLGRHDSAADEIWPGAETLTARASRACGPELLGPQAEEAGAGDDLRWVVWTPSEQSWEEGDRAGLCLAAGDAPRTGTLLE